MRILYHFPTSTFARRARLALAHKGIEVELRDARGSSQALAEAKKVSPLGTIPVLVDQGRVIGDSNSIAHYLDKTYPEKPMLWPTEDADHTFEVASLVDGVLNGLVDLGTRYWPLRDHHAWEEVKNERLARIEGAMERLAMIVSGLTRPTITRAGWAAPDMWLYCAVTWLEGLPARAPTAPLPAQIVSLGWSLPSALPTWADAHRGRADVKALG